MGRPATKPIKFKDGYYISVSNRGSKTGIKIGSPDIEGMHRNIEHYRKSKDINVLGECKNGSFIDKQPAKLYKVTL